MDIRSVEDVLDLAIRNEKESADFYRKWASAATLPATRELLESLVKDEKFHQEKLVRVREGKLAFRSGAAMQSVIDLAAQGQGKPVPTKGAGYAVVVAWAMEREKQTCRLYARLADGVEGAKLKEVLFALADQEQRHYVRLHAEMANARSSSAVRGQFRPKLPG